MNRICKNAIAVLTAIGVSAGGATTATATSAAALSKADAQFLKSNEQVNLAEITLAKIVLKRSHTYHGRELARMTMRDHLAAQKKVEAVAKADGLKLPTTPSAAQRAVAARLTTAKHVNYRYFKDQITGHKTSIAQTKVEIASGSKRNVVQYANYYLPVAEKHLAMSKNDLARWYRYN